MKMHLILENEPPYAEGACPEGFRSQERQGTEEYLLSVSL